MKLDLQTTRQLLPCFVCGDLDEDVAAQVQAVLDANPRLQAEADAMRSAEAACLELMAELAGEIPDLGPISLVPDQDDFPGSPPVAAPAQPALAPAALAPAWSLLAAAAALVLVFLGAWRLGQHPPVDGLLAQHQPFVSQQVDGFIAETDPTALGMALMATEAGAYLGMVSDLSPLGLELVGGGLATGDRLGTVVVYTDGDKRYVCQMYGRPAPTDPPDIVKQVGAHTLRAYQVGELSVVVWEEGGMVCLWSGQGTPEQMLAMVEEKMTKLG